MEFTQFITVLKHLPGQHNQADHAGGRGKGKVKKTPEGSGAPKIGDVVDEGPGQGTWTLKKRMNSKQVSRAGVKGDQGKVYMRKLNSLRDYMRDGVVQEFADKGYKYVVELQDNGMALSSNPESGSWDYWK